MKFVIKTWMENKIACILLFIVFISSTGCSIVNNVITKRISECISDLSNYQSILISIVGLCVMKIIFRCLYYYSNTLSSAHIFVYLNNKFADKILDSDFPLFMKYSTSEITTTYEAINIIVDVGKELLIIINLITEVVVILVSIYLLSGVLVFPIIVIYIIGGLLIFYLYKIYMMYDEKFDVQRRKRNQKIYDIIEGFVEVRTFHTQSYFRKSIRNMNECQNKILKDRSKIDVMITFTYHIMDTIVKIISILYIISHIQKGVINVATGMALIIYVNNGFGPLEDFIYISSDLSSKFVKINKYVTFMNYQNSIHNYKETVTNFQKEIKFQHVDFSYPDGNESVLKNINVTIQKGQRVGVCGISGIGKSTIFKLLSRFYEPTNGSITIDGIDIKHITEDSYRSMICSVHQENVIFNGSIKENIMYGSLDKTDDEIIEATRKANLYDFIMKLDQRFDTQVGPKGLKLSGGQKQRIALARLFLRNPDIILLDEATSALDNESEDLIQDSLKNLRKDQTIISIAHRLTTIKDCDIIYVLGNEGVIESGNHESLMKQKGEYYKMYNIRAKENKK